MSPDVHCGCGRFYDAYTWTRCPSCGAPQLPPRRSARDARQESRGGARAAIAALRGLE